jgi:hypothetical protein
MEIEQMMACLLAEMKTEITNHAKAHANLKMKAGHEEMMAEIRQSR